MTSSIPGVCAPLLPAPRCHATRKKSGSCTRLNRSSNLRPESPLAHRCSFVCIRCTFIWAPSIRAHMSSLVFTGEPPTITTTPLPDTLPPFAMWPAFPASDYYDGAAPDAPFDRHRIYPPTRSELMERNAFPWFEQAYISRGVTTPVPRVYLLVSPTGPGPSRNPEPSRLCHGCSHLHHQSVDQAAVSFSQQLRLPADEGLPPPFEIQAPRGAPPLMRNPTRRGDETG